MANTCGWREKPDPPRAGFTVAIRHVRLAPPVSLGVESPELWTFHNNIRRRCERGVLNASRDCVGHCEGPADLSFGLCLTDPSSCSGIFIFTLPCVRCASKDVLKNDLLVPVLVFVCARYPTVEW